ncbi:heroin esterase [Rhodococcus ruber BKS 20-38]|uniref:Heroin esterase n=1 Tax=Rhodococcus ruber BKS 20-38 TaxID=1278076 RepID=M2Z6F3_9NOCA|nr:alpha/beta hydrolase fold domain-containing protein [Rhodococcus ruber]EME56234.1 heroin esterase [Rhodococcus ruber BKS 20-38]
MPELIPDSTEVDPEPAAATTLLSDPDGDRPDLDSVVAAAGPGGTVEEWLVPGALGDPEVPVRIHTPDTGPIGNPAARPVVLEIPGGGSALGGATHREAFAFAVARATGAIVVSVGYRLAAEDPTAAADDCYAVLEWVASGTACPDMDPDRIVVLGDAAGGALAATVALRAREEGGPCIALQALLDPDLAPGPDAPGSRPHPFGGREATGQSVPARRIDLTGMPSTYLTVGERAPFRGEATDYARRLRQAGVPVELHCRPGISDESVLVRDAGATRALCDAIVRATARTPVLDHD